MDRGLLFCVGICSVVVFTSDAVGAQARNVSKDVGHENNLHHYLLQDYNKDVRPAAVDQPVNVEVGLSVIRLHSFDVKNEMLECQAWLRLVWQDVSLRWDPADHGGVTEITVSATRLWTPDIKLYNSVDHVDNIDPDLNALVFNDGRVAYIPRMTLRSHCNINKTRWGRPNNDQSCPLRFGSWVYNGAMVAMWHQGRSEHGHVDLSDYIPKSKFEWYIKGATAVLNNKKYPCCETPFPDITFNMKMHREEFVVHEDVAMDNKVYLINIGAILLIPLLFLLPFESKSKVTLGCTGLVCLVLILMSAPDQAAATLCEVNFILLAVALVLTAILMNFWHCDSATKPIPSGYQRCVEILAKVLCVRHTPNFDGDDFAQLHDTGDDSTLRVVTSPSSRYVCSWRTLVIVIDRILCGVFLVTAILANMAAGGSI